MRILNYTNEIFEECKSYPNYFCSQSGKVLSIFVRGGRGAVDITNPHFLKPKTDKDGYYEYTFKVNKKRVSVRGHRLVAEQYLCDYSSELLVNHKDGNKQNNNITNLEMVTPQENTIHAWRIGLIKVANCSKPVTVYTDNKEYKFTSMKRAIARFNDIPITYLNEINNNTHQRYPRMYFERVNGLIYCYSNGEVITTYRTNREIATQFNKADNTISYKVNNIKDLIYKKYHIVFNKSQSTIKSG